MPFGIIVLGFVNRKLPIKCSLSIRLAEKSEREGCTFLGFGLVQNIS